MKQKEIDRAAVAAWDAWYMLWFAKNDLEEIPKEDRSKSMVYGLNRANEMIGSIDSLLEERRFADPKYLGCVLSIFERFKTHARCIRNILNDYEKAKSSLYYREKRQILDSVIEEKEFLKQCTIIQEKQIKALEGVLANYIELGKIKKQEAPPIKNINTLHPNITMGQILMLWEGLKSVFPCEYKQFARLFDEPITQEAPPIKVGAIVDAASLVYFLREYKKIQSSEPFVVLEKVRAFECRGRVITSKQYRHALEDKEIGGYIGKYYSEIEGVIMKI